MEQPNRDEAPDSVSEQDAASARIVRRVQRITHEPVAMREAPAPGIAHVLEAPAFQGDFWQLGDGLFGGWAFDPRHPERKLAVELWLDGTVTSLVRADLFVPELREAEGTDGCHGFATSLKLSSLAHTRQVSAYVANTDHHLGTVHLHSTGSSRPVKPEDIAGSVRWVGGIRVVGWARDRVHIERTLTVSLFEGSRLLAEVPADMWYEPGPDEPLAPGRHGFDVTLPLELADGRLHEIRVLTERGTELAGSPIALLTLGSGIEQFGLADSETSSKDAVERLAYLERLMPSSLPLTSYPDWRRAYAPKAPELAETPRIAAVVFGPPEQADETLQSLDTASAPLWTAVALESLTVGGVEAWREARAHLVEEGSEIIVVLKAGSRVHPAALAALAAAMVGPDKPALVYSDSEIALADGTLLPRFKPAFDKERFLAQGYLCDLVAFDAALLPELDHDESVSDYGVVAQVLAGALAAERPIGHLPEVLATVPAGSTEADADALVAALPPLLDPERETHVMVREGLLFPAIRVRPAVDPDALVSILIPTRDRLDLLRPCVESLFAKTAHPAFEILIADNDSRDEDTLAYFRELAYRGVRVLPAPGPFNYARINNAAARAANGRYLLLLNNDTEVEDRDWLTALLEPGSAADVGAVGAKLLWPSGLVQHGGVVLGSHFGAAHAFNERQGDEPGYDELLQVTRETSAVTAACLLVKRKDYFAVGGLDERLFPVNFNDVDLCLKLRAIGRRNIWTPHAALRHKESASRGQDANAERQSRTRRELNALRLKWGETLVADPLYSPCLNRDAYPYTGIAWPPRERALRRNLPPQPNAMFKWLS
ncbi:glycosyltransferase family 2 protein [Chelatococcus asaccharovorans]|uniref:glycosyltransferase family 2 protein n=1 Tax=Chelatococcus asaccharovorans TaxID=28210 RepID=UPI00224C690E|nr:glycosyltransferase [Chelatococcus asaccharovorans]CAH1651398.1 GT2 family glycosyltransferase [Chelatococcus asaccharovorans]CAH1686625.1 GT2 family glycosyltransferase [Chelatococcus asaccharovorans]